jgi:hypothetical protein
MHDTTRFYRCDNLTRDHNAAGLMRFDLNQIAIFPVFSSEAAQALRDRDRPVSYLVKREQGPDSDWHKLHITSPVNWYSF